MSKSPLSKENESINKLLDRAIKEFDPALNELFVTIKKFLKRKATSLLIPRYPIKKEILESQANVKLINERLGTLRNELSKLLAQKSKLTVSEVENAVRGTIKSILDIKNNGYAEAFDDLAPADFLKQYYEKQSEISKNVLQRILGVQSRDEISQAAYETMHSIMKTARMSLKGDTMDPNYNFIIDEKLLDEGLDTFERNQLEKMRHRINDAFMEVSRTISDDLNKEVGIEWYYYEGPTSLGTRDFCKERVGHFFHKTEIEKWPEEEWKGKKPGTNKETIYIFCGGYNCRHQLLAVLEDQVPSKYLKKING